MDNITVGRQVHYVMPDGIAHRPATVVQVFPQSPSDSPMCNMTVFPDMLNDHRYGPDWANKVGVGKGSVHYSETKEPNTWHWPERE